MRNSNRFISFLSLSVTVSLLVIALLLESSPMLTLRRAFSPFRRRRRLTPPPQVRFPPLPLILLLVVLLIMFYLKIEM